MILGPGTRDCFHNECRSIVLMFLPIVLYLQIAGPYDLMCEIYGFSMTTLIVLLFTFANPPLQLWITASSLRFTTLLSPVAEIIFSPLH